MNEPGAIAALPEGLTLREAEGRDIPEMLEVVNAAFQVENFFVDRPRTNAAQLAESLEGGHFLLAHRGAELVASVYYELRGGERGYIGMLAVRSDAQRLGLGSAMMAAAEQALLRQGCKVAELSVVSVRAELPPVYRKLGYREAGTVETPEELRQKLTMPIELIRMEKRISG